MITYEKTSRLADAMLAKVMLSGLENFYPDFGYWYVNQCMPGILAGRDTLIVAREHHQVIGVALGKKSEDETKLRCIRVLPQYQQRGVGIHLIDKSLLALDCDKSLCTVSEEMIHQYSRPFVNRFNFELSSVDRGVYRRNKLEYVFNQSR